MSCSLIGSLSSSTANQRAAQNNYYIEPDFGVPSFLLPKLFYTCKKMNEFPFWYLFQWICLIWSSVISQLSKLQIRWIFWTISWHFADSFCFRDRKWLKAFPIGLHPHFYDLFVIQIIEIFFSNGEWTVLNLLRFV